MVIESKNRRHELVQAAAKLFRQKGYARATVRDLAQAVGMQSGSLFHHFKTKEDILFAVMEEVILMITQKMIIALKQVQSPREKVRSLIRSELEAILGETHDAMTVLVYEWRSLSEENQQKILPLRTEYEELWLDTLREAQAAGLIAIDIFVLRRFLNGALSWTINWYREDGDLDLDRLADQALSLAIKPE